MGNIVVGIGGGVGWYKRVPWRFVALIIVVVLVAGGAGAGLRWWQQSRQPAEDFSRTGEQIFAKEVTDAQNLTLEGDYDKAHETIENALDDSGISAQEKHDLLIQQGVAYENQEKYDEALESYRQAETAKQSLQAAQSIAGIAVIQGNKELAITYYRKAITLIPADSPVADSLRDYFKGQIEFLETGQPPA